MTITVRFFAILRDRLSISNAELTVPADSTAGAVRKELSQRFPAIADLLPSVALAVNREYVHSRAILYDGDELALIPPVSGG